MSTELVSGSERAANLQATIQQELAVKGYSTAEDPVMAEYITIMLINSKTPEQITNELQDLIGDEYDPEFTDWLFAAKANPAVAKVPTGPAAEVPSQAALIENNSSQSLPDTRNSSGATRGGRSHAQSRPLINQALSSIPSADSIPPSSSGQKRTSSARSPSPSNAGPASKRRNADLPDRPRAMRDEGAPTSATRSNRPSLLERVGPISTRPGPNNGPVDRIQAQIDAVTGSSNAPRHPHQPPPPQAPPFNNGFPHQMMMPGMMPNMMPGMMNPHELMQGMMEAQMAMAQFGQMAVQMGLVPGVSMDPGLQGNNAQATSGNAGDNFASGVDRGRRGRGGHQAGRGRGGPPGSRGPAQHSNAPTSQPALNTSNAILPPAAAPRPPPTLHQPNPVLSQVSNSQSVPTRPLSPTLCKFSTACTHANCRYSHPSPAATPESGMVLSNDPCAKGLNCDDKDCTFAHISKAAKGTIGNENTTQNGTPPANASKIPCKFNPHCTRPGCAFLHFTPGSKDLSVTPCRFGGSCTRADCPYGHPTGRVLPSAFSQGLGPAAPTLIKPSSDFSQNRSVDFRTRAKVNNLNTPEKSTTQLSKDAVPFTPSAVGGSGAKLNSDGTEAKTEPVSVA